LWEVTARLVMRPGSLFASYRRAEEWLEFSGRQALRMARACSFCCSFEPRNSVNGCAEEREGEGARNRRLWLTDSTAKARIGHGTRTFPARNFSPTVAPSVRVPEGEGRGECRLEWEWFKEREALQEGAG
jgi:hypothetical protein